MGQPTLAAPPAIPISLPNQIISPMKYLIPFLALGLIACNEEPHDITYQSYPVVQFKACISNAQTVNQADKCHEVYNQR